jgi:RNA polymerase sigma-70 factor (family 1)
MEKSKQTDQSILEMIGKNEDQAFALLYKQYWQPLLHFAARYLHDRDACEEITQELFIKLHDRRLTLKINSSMSSYLYSALRNRIFNYIRDQAVYRKHINIAATRIMLSQNNVEQSIYMKELQEEIYFSLECMPSKYKEVYLLHERDHFTIRGISATLGRPVDTVEKQLRKAKRMLQNFLTLYNHMTVGNRSSRIRRTSR